MNMAVVRREKADVAAVMETQGINALQTRGNDKVRRCPRKRFRARRRDPPWGRKGGRRRIKDSRDRGRKTLRGHPGWGGTAEGDGPSVMDDRMKKVMKEMGKLKRRHQRRAERDAERRGPLDTETARASRRVQVLQRRHGKREEEEAKATAAWTAPYASAYTARQRRRMERDGLSGPLDLCAPPNRRLLLQYMAKRSGRVQWELLEEKWGSPTAALRVAKEVQKLK